MSPGGAILHVVLLRLPEGHDAAELAEVMAGLAALDLPGMSGFHHGPNLDLEGLSPGLSYGFAARFESREALKLYAEDPAHRALGARLLALVGGPTGLLVADIGG
ncbi:Dabb family protein [Pseudoroseicyclus sp. CXY001]|uniref:Dabb family protein n=1 Tax=Pseudoroseicyclus sp. CXY001 TaxID=3242492 RepID=UPI003570DEF2